MFANAVDTAEPAASAEQGDTVALLVSRELFETALRERSPLDPRVLDQIVRGIADSRPTQLAIDLDLSPSPSDADLPGAEAARASVLHYLQAMASQGTRVLVVLPGVSATPAEQARKAQWAGTVCQAGVELADTSLGLSHTPAGLSLLKYVAELPSLGVLMAERGRAGLCASRNADGSLPTLMLSPNGAAASVMNASHSEDRVRINFKGFNATRVLTLTTLDDIAQLPQRLALAQARTVLLAGAYSAADSFMLPNGRQVTGAEVHAAVAFSEAHPVQAQHALAYLIDLVVGCCVGLVLELLWHAYQKSHLVYVKAACLGGACLTIALPILLLWFFMAQMLAADLWMNAVPLVIGLAIHGIMETLHSDHAAPALVGGEKMLEIGVQKTWLGLRWGLLLWGLYLFAMAVYHLFLVH
jgi:hypothetical protein